MPHQKLKNDEKPDEQIGEYTFRDVSEKTFIQWLIWGPGDIDSLGVVRLDRGRYASLRKGKHIGLSRNKLNAAKKLTEAAKKEVVA